ncbi:MAG TPA: MBL fold metallo-hydrolase [Casimicrobiaceae bacterium]|jgi:glyoxylase-like metal-dependent hydrolase (beta-lactamase superfamily II)|nr:MBL fold metallo-hydrolase [Casimicrobiaceae bacterium]
MPKPVDRNPASAPGDWYIDTHCIDCAASREVAPGLVIRRRGKSVFARQPANEEEEFAAWRAVLVCPTASVGTESYYAQPPGLFPEELAPGVYRCGYNAASSFGAHSYFARRDEGNLLIDSPRYVNKLVHELEDLGGVADILLTHRDDVADADRYARHFGARVWIHEDDRSAAPYATKLLRGIEPVEIRKHLLAIPIPGHTRGSVVFLLAETYLFTGDSLAWSHERKDLQAFRDACWYSWSELDTATGRLTRLALAPMQIRHFRLNHASAADARWLEQKLTHQGKRYGTRVAPESDMPVVRWNGH